MMNLRIIGYACSVMVLASIFAGLHADAAPIPDDIFEDLKSQEFKVREEAESRLLEWARKDHQARIPLLLGQAREAPDPEVRQRSLNVLYALAMDEYLRDGEGFVGIQMNPIRAQIPGEGDELREVIVISRVLRDTPAREAGLRVGDLIVSVDGENLASDNALPSFQIMIKAMKPGTLTRFGIIRDGALIEIDLKLARRPPDETARFFGQQMLDMNELAKRDQDRFFKEWLQNLEILEN